MNVYDRKIPDESLDIYMTSPPCQAFSVNGKRKGEDDERGILFYNSLEFIKINNPKTFVFENVKGLTNHDKGGTFKRWIELLSELDYKIHYNVLCALDSDIPQNRHRVFIVGIRGDLGVDYKFPEAKESRRKLVDILEDEIVHGFREDRFLIDGNEHCAKIKTPTKKGYVIARKLVDSVNFAFPTSETRRGRVGVEFAQTLDTQANQGVYIGNGLFRRFTVRECSRLMDFPDEFDVSAVTELQARKQLGNSIPVGMLERVLTPILDYFKNV